jgi:four helix bundle protein
VSHIGSAVAPTTSESGAPGVTADRLDVYRIAAEFQHLASDLARRSPHPFRDQLERASLSIVLNIAEGYGRSSPADKARSYVIASGSARESQALLEILTHRSIVPEAPCAAALALVARVIRMLERLEASMRGRHTPRS